MDIEHKEELKKRRKAQKKEHYQFIGRRIYEILGSPVGVVILLMIYSFIGAAIFRAIEGPVEEQRNKEKEKVGEIRKTLEEVLQPYLKINTSELPESLTQSLRDYESSIYEAFQNGSDLNSPAHVWDFWGSFLYCGTIYTTIGYGHISPSSKWGKIVTMLYAIPGIPLCLIVMASIGRLLSRFFKWAWHRISCRKKRLKNLMKKSLMTGNDENANDPGQETEVVLNLPILVAVIIVFVYICIGAGLYLIWETWDYLEAFYFIFISISTIGFGDVVPDHPRYFLASSLYVLFGLSMVAMAITVIMEALAEKMFTAKAKIEHKVEEIISRTESHKEEEGV